MTLSFTGRKRLRKYFGKIIEVAEMPNLIEVQKTSYDQFLQVVKPEGGRKDEAWGELTRIATEFCIAPRNRAG